MGLFQKFPKNFSDSIDGGLHRTFGAPVYLGNLRKRKTIQGIEQKPLPLSVGAERQHGQKFIQRFPLANQFLRRGTIGQAALRGDYVLVKLASVPVPPLFVGKVLRLVVLSSVQIFGV